jgi:hypothetical protein
LVALYGEGLDLRLRDTDRVVERTEGVTASFIKELMRKAALVAAEAADGAGTPDETVIPPVLDEHMRVALDELLAEGNAMTRALLGGSAPEEEDERDGRTSRRTSGRGRWPRPASFGVNFVEMDP